MAVAPSPDPPLLDEKSSRGGLLAAALAYASRGVPVFPLAPRSKKPYKGSHGFKDATTDEAQIREWWKDHPKAGIGINCGEAGLLVLDVDPDHGGSESLERFRREVSELPETPTVNSGSGGQHFYFAKPDTPTKSGKLPGYPGLDIKADGGYVVAPPSLHPSGGRYEWAESLENLDPAVPPEALGRLLGGSASNPEERPDRSRTGLPVGKVALRALTDGLPAPQGEQTHRTVAVGIARNFYEAGRSEEEVRVLMAQILSHPGSALDPNRPWTSEDVETIVGSVAREPAPDAASHRKRRSIADRFNPIDLSETWDEVEEPEWAIEGLFLRGKYHEFVGQMGSGKSLALLGLIVTEAFPLGLRVAYLDEENGADEIRRRLKALGADPQDVSKFFVYLSDLSPTTKEADEAVALIADQDVDLAVFDSLADFYIASELDEQSNKDATEWAKALPEPLAHEYGVATIGVDHTGHADDTRARGASAKGAKADATWQVKVVEDREFDAETMGQMRLTRGRKNRQGVLPESHLLKIGGDGNGRTIFERLPDRKAVDEKKRAVAEDKEFKRAVLDVLREAGEQGLGKAKLCEALREAGQKGDTTRMLKRVERVIEGSGGEVLVEKSGTRHRYLLRSARKGS